MKQKRRCQECTHLRRRYDYYLCDLEGRPPPRVDLDDVCDAFEAVSIKIQKQRAMERYKTRVPADVRLALSEWAGKQLKMLEDER